MTNASKISSVSVLVLAMAVLAFGAFATTVNADDGNVGYLELGGSYVPDYSASYEPDYSSSYAPDYSGSYAPDYSSSYYPDYSGSYYPDYTSSYAPDYSGSYYPDYTSSYAPDYTSSYAPDYLSSYAPDYTASYAPDYTSSYAPDYTSSYAPDYTSSYAPDYVADCSFECFMQDDVMYSYSESFAQQSCSYCQSHSKSTPPMKFSPPSYPPSRPTPPSYPPSYPQPPRPQPQPPVVFPPTHANAQTNVNTNTCLNNSCNTNVNNIDNSINGSFNTAPVIPVQTLPPQQLIQYIAPPMAGAFCVITASPTHIQNGQATVLSWTSSGGAAWLSDGIGHVAPNGTLLARPNVSTNYVLTVNGPRGPYTCNVFVQVQGSYVSLTQIPYTGFDLGAFGNAAYWAGLLSFAGAAAYLVLYYQGGMGSFVPSFAGSITLPKLPKLSLPKLAVAKREEENEATLAAPVMFTKKYVAPAIASKQTATREIDNLPMVRSVAAPKDAMTFDSGKIVVSRN